MYLKILGYVFCITSLILSLLFSCRFFLGKKSFSTHFITLITVFLFLYILEALFFIVAADDMIIKVAMVLFAAVPFVIGHFATYKTQDIFGFAQIASVLSSSVLIWFMVVTT